MHRPLPHLGATLIGLSFSLAASAQSPAVPRAERAPELRLTGDKVVLPLVMVREYPFIQGEIAGIRGKLMLDTGADQALAVNDHRVPLPGSKPTGTGHFGSGQAFQTRMNASVPGIAIGPLHFPRATRVASQDASQLERITPDFLGWIGFYFWQGYAMKLDYARAEVTFFRGGGEQYLAGETVLAAIPFQTRKLPNHPLVPIRIGEIEAIADFDTGQYGSLFTDEATRTRFVQAGLLRNPHGTAFDLTGLVIDGKPVPDTPHIDVILGTFAAAEPIGIHEKTVLTIGYGLLSQYKTVWDYRSHTLYLLAR